MSTPSQPETAPPERGEVFSFRQRLVIALVSAAVTLLIRLIGPTLRFRVEIEEGGPPEPLLVPAVYAFWHRCIFPATWFYRNRQVAVMTSRSFDGEYIARIIENLGFRAVRGSSSRGAVRALLGMHGELEAGRTAAFTIDGPRGPRYVAKPGPVLLARNARLPLICFHIAVERAWILPTWDALIIPQPFSRALLRVSRMMRVPAESDSAALERYQGEMQATLDRVRQYAETALPGSSADRQ